MKNTTKPANAFAAFVASDEQAKKAVSTPAGEWPFTTTAAQLVKGGNAVTSPVKAAPKRATVAQKSESKAAAKAYKGDLKFIVRGSGAQKLFAHTAAWLEVTGLIHGKSAPLELVKELGGSAYSYHFKQGNFTAPLGGMVELTAKGLNHFGARESAAEGGAGAGQRFDPVDKQDYILMMTQDDGAGNPIYDDRLIKDHSAIRAYNPK